MTQAGKEVDNYWDSDKIQKYESGMLLVEKVIDEVDAGEYEKTGKHMIRFVEKRLKSPESITNKLRRKGVCDEDCKSDYFQNGVERWIFW